jgi:hypothetical protein
MQGIGAQRLLTNVFPKKESESSLEEQLLQNKGLKLNIIPNKLFSQTV